MKIRIEIESQIHDSMNFDDWLDTITKNLCEWTEKHTFDETKDVWIIEIDGVE